MVVVNVPEDAEVYLQGQKMTLTGAERRFVSPQLTNGKGYIYTVKVTVTRDGKTFEKTTEARITAGETVNVAVKLDDAKVDATELVAAVTR